MADQGIGQLSNDPEGLVRVNGFNGINNRVDPTTLGLKWQLEAVNVLSDDGEYLVTCPGYEVYLADVVDAYASRDGRTFVALTSGTLYELMANDSYRLRAIGFTGGPFSWCDMGGLIYARGESTAWIIGPRSVAAWGVPTVDPPTVEACPGNLPGGTYLVASILESPDGRTGGCTGFTSVEYTSGGGLRITSPVVNGYKTRLYLSEADGPTTYYVGDLVSGALEITTPPIYGVELNTLNLYAPPTGSVIGRFGSRIAIGAWEAEKDLSAVYFSRPDTPHLFELDIDFQLFPGRITLLAGVADELLVGTDRALYVITPDKKAQVLIAAGTATDSACWMDNGSVAVWTDLGLVTYPPFKLVTDGVLIPNNRERSSAALLDHNGSQYYVVTMQGTERPAAIPLPYYPMATDE